MAISQWRFGWGFSALAGRQEREWRYKKEDMPVQDLNRLFRPRTVAIVGASDKNPWSAIAARTLVDIGYVGTVHLVNRRGTPALGQTTIVSCAEAEGGIDAAFVAVPADHLLDALEDMAAGGVTCGAVVLQGLPKSANREPPCSETFSPGPPSSASRCSDPTVWDSPTLSIASRWVQCRCRRRLCQTLASAWSARAARRRS
jgi:predicted CoA-binding protein